MYQTKWDCNSNLTLNMSKIHLSSVQKQALGLGGRNGKRHFYGYSEMKIEFVENCQL